MYVHVNAAESVDGKLSSRRREQIEISGSADFARVDRLRAESDGVLVGIGTVLADDPSLLRHDESHRTDRFGPDVDPPARVVVDSRCRTPTDAAVVRGAATTYVLTSETAPESRIEALRDAGVTVVVAGEDRVDLPTALERLETKGIERLLVEGGGEIIFSLFSADLVDRLTVYVGGVVVGGRDAPTLVDGEGFTEAFPRLQLDAIERLDDGVVLSWTPADDRANRGEMASCD
ncbi:MAG: 2,5-diamino-6-(ribosylamino)-4(3H)-pyrimidinone 5'-phosphate reductase [Natronomonas sp.]